MAAVAEMGEVDEMHSKDESSILTNGDLSTDMDEENIDSDDVKKMSGPEAEEEEDEEEEMSSTTYEAKERSEKEEETPEEGTEENSMDEMKEDEDASQEDDKSDKDDDSDEVSSSSSSSEDEDKSDDECDKSEEKRDEEEAEGEDLENEEEKNDENSISKDVEIHEIDSEEEDDKEKKETTDNDELIELNDSGGEGDGDVMIVDSPKQNGGTEVIDLDETPEKSAVVPEVKEIDNAAKNKNPEKQITPRRSSRNLNKSKSYAENDHEVVEKPPSEESDIEEVLPEDPLACNNSITVEKITVDKSKPSVTGNKQSTIVVKDTKRLVEIASKSSSNSSGQGKKEPTLVIIDTNSILSGKGPVPVNNSKGPVTNYSTVLPMALPAQGMYPPNMRATITPIPVNATSTTTPPAKTSPATITPAIGVPLLPSLTDDMFVVEAPSFIVPYVYEKPPSRTIGDFLKDLEKEKDEGPKDKKEKDKSSSSKDKDVEIENDKSIDHQDDSKKSYSFFDSPLGKFFINIGFNLVQEHVQTDLLKQQKRKAYREGNSNTETEKSIHTLTKNLEFSKENNEPYRLDVKKCEFCTFRTESSLAMAYHLETPHMKAFVYRCNFCPFEVRSPHDILFHMEAEHAVRGHLERAPAFHQCPNCPFEDNQKGKLSRHLVACSRKFKPERNLEPPVDWEPPAKIPRVPKMRQQGLNATVTAYHSMAKTAQYQFLSKMQLQSTQQVLHRGRGRPTLGPTTTTPQNVQAVKTPQGTVLRPASTTSMVFKQGTMAGGSVLVPASYQLGGSQVFQVVGGQEIGSRLGSSSHMFLPNAPPSGTVQNLNQKKSNQQQPSISITPLPRGTGAMSSTSSPVTSAKPGDTTSKNAFVICEICDGYIKDLEQLRNHMQWIHKIKIHPKMIYNRPPLNCQKCQFRFFTDQGLERHLLGSHGLVTSSMQDAANKSRDSGRCPVCGRVYQWKLLNHVARDHNMTLKPAHLSYKCTVCTATFGMYKQFENHVYSAHSVVAKRVMDKKSASAASSSSPSSSASLSSKSSADQLKPLKINDEITIIPQPTSTKATANATANGKEGSPGKSGAGRSR